MSETNIAEALDFGDYCIIEQKRYVGENEMFLYKVVSGIDETKVERFRLSDVKKSNLFKT